MAYSPEGYKAACELVIPRLLGAIEKLAPGTAQGIIDDVAKEASAGADRGDQSLKDALFVAAEWSSTARAVPAASNEAQRVPEQSLGSGTLQILAAAQLGFTVAMTLLHELARKTPPADLVPFVLDSVAQSIDPTGPIEKEQLRLLKEYRKSDVQGQRAR